MNAVATENVRATKGALSRRKAAHYLDISMTTLDKLAKEGRITRLHVKRKTLFAVDELDRFLDRLAAESTAG